MIKVLNNLVITFITAILFITSAIFPITKSDPESTYDQVVNVSDGANDDKQVHDVSNISADTIKLKIESKISIFEKQHKLNAEAISQLQKELDERKKLEERLNAAILVSKEILNEFVPDEQPGNSSTEN